MLCLNLAYCFGASSLAIPPTGHYSGAVTRDGSVQLMSITLSEEDSVRTGRYSIPEAGIFNVLCEGFDQRDDSLYFSCFYGGFACRYFAEQDAYVGESVRWDPRIRIHLKRAVAEPLPYTPITVNFGNGATELKGTLFEPLGATAFPVAILIHGSEDQHRETWYYHSLGHALAKRGIGAFLYDKRGCGKSTGDHEAATMQELADDAVAAYAALRLRHGKQITRMGFLGTSQGGWIAPIAASRVTDCGFVILNVGPSVSVFEQDIHRLQYGMPDDGYEQATVDSAMAYTRLYFNYVRNGKKKERNALEAYGRCIRERDWAEYVNIDLNEADLAWWRMNDYDPSAMLTTMQCPTLAIYGGLDLLVPPAENETRMEELLAKSGAKHEVVTIADMAHDGRSSQGLNGDNWDWPRVFWRWRKQPEEFMERIVHHIDRLH